MIDRIHFVASQSEPARKAAAELQSCYKQTPVAEAEVIVALGGDGFMLRTLHRFIKSGLPVFGMKIGNVGFLMNLFHKNDLPERLAKARNVVLNPLCMESSQINLI